jgi:hypothetical protein
MTDDRIYVIVPETVQVTIPGKWDFPNGVNAPAEQLPDTVESYSLVPGRLIAQGVHIGRKIGAWLAQREIPYEDVTTIVLSVRNTKELRKVSTEMSVALSLHALNVGYQEFHDTNLEFYGTDATVHTITAVGPLSPEVREKLEDSMGHLELY